MTPFIPIDFFSPESLIINHDHLYQNALLESTSKIAGVLIFLHIVNGLSI